MKGIEHFDSSWFRGDGTLDPERLASAGGEWVLSWLRARLSGNPDLLLPVDLRVDEDPEIVVVGILRSIGCSHPAADLISRGALRLLDEARQSFPSAAPYLFPLLRICQQIYMPRLSSWFTEELSLFGDHFEERSDFWGDQSEGILFAAIIQAPGLPGRAAQPHWLKLLHMSSCSTIALRGLGPSLELRMPYLVVWWSVCSPENRARDIRNMMYSALKSTGVSSLRELLLNYRESLPVDMQKEIDASLLENGAAPILLGYPNKSVFHRAIVGSGIRPEIFDKELQ